MTGVSAERFRDSGKKIVEEENREGWWPVYEVYEMPGPPRSRYLYAPRAIGDNELNPEWTSLPLSQNSAGLFLEFANWPVECKMDKIAPNFGTLDTDSNAAAAKKWAETYGVLGLGKNPNESHHIGSSASLGRTTSLYIGDRNSSCIGGRASRMSPRGGPHETVEEFAREAWEAHVALRLYVLASREQIDVDAISRFMGDTPGPRLRASKPHSPSEREMNTSYDWLARGWAEGIVEEAVMSKVENTCYPAIFGSPGAYVQGWGCKSLLGAMWLQMMWLMVAEDNKCQWCGEPFERVSAGRKRRFCAGTTCRQSWNYHSGVGKSSRDAKKAGRKAG